MKIIDLSHTMSADMPVYPGTEQPVFASGCSIQEDGFAEKKITFFSHTGTHIDAPAHLLKGKKSLDLLPLEHFYGSALMLDFASFDCETIGLEALEPFRHKLKNVDFLLLHTGWSRYWGNGKYFANYKVLSVEAAIWLNSFQLKGIGLDTISADSADSKNYPVHKVLLEQETIIIENLTNLLMLPQDNFAFSCFPLKYKDADGSPVRAVAYLTNNPNFPTHGA